MGTNRKRGARYRCPICGLTLSAVEASRKGFTCHGQPMERVEPSQPGMDLREKVAGLAGGLISSLRRVPAEAPRAAPGAGPPVTAAVLHVQAPVLQGDEGTSPDRARRAVGAAAGAGGAGPSQRDEQPGLQGAAAPVPSEPARAGKAEGTQGEREAVAGRAAAQRKEAVAGAQAAPQKEKAVGGAQAAPQSEQAVAGRPDEHSRSITLSAAEAKVRECSSPAAPGAQAAEAPGEGGQVPSLEGGRVPSVEVVEVIPPANNQVDALAVETFLGGLATKELFSLEIYGDERGKHFLVRGAPETVRHVKALLASVYNQVAFAAVSPEGDPALLASRDDFCVATTRLVLRRPPYLPLRTFRDGDFRDADPMKGLLGPFGDLEAGERALSQLVLKPAPPNWADSYSVSLRRLDQSFGGGSSAAGGLAPLLSFVVLPGILLLLLRAYLWFREGQYLPLLLVAIGLPAMLVALFVLARHLLGPRNVDPVLVQRKVALPAYDACVRLVAMAPDVAKAESRLGQLVAAYHQFDLSSGNAFVLKEDSFDPSILPAVFWSWWDGLLGRLVRLNTGEIASLWHLPVGEVSGVGQVLSKAVLPMRDQVAEGVLVGHSRAYGVEIPVHLSSEAMGAHMLLVGKTQKGKSALMQHLVHATVQDQGCAVVVIDPHGDLAKSCLGIVPPPRVADTIYVDFSHEEHVVGINVLDVNQGRSADKIVSNLVHVCSLIWADYWGPRMEDAFRAGIRTLLEVNAQLSGDEPQFTILDLPALFELESFQNRMLYHYAHDVETLRWWVGYYQQLYPSLKMDVINPVQTKIHRFTTSSVVRRIVGQSSSTVDFREILDQRRIVLVNTASSVIGEDAGGLLGAVLLDNLNITIREQMRLPPEHRARVMVFIDEFQAIPGVDYASLLAELAKMGANFVLATQSLGQLDLVDRSQRVFTRALRPTVLANVDTLFIFQTSAEDARTLVWELDRKVEEVDVINQPDFVCYLKTKRGRERLPIMQLHTLPPVPGRPEIEERVRENMRRYARPASAVDGERINFQARHYQAELKAYEAERRRRFERGRGKELGLSAPRKGSRPR